MSKKRCSKCKKTKSISAFQKDKGSRDGYQTYCKDCRKTYYKRREKKTKTCYVCGEEKRLDEFYRNKSRRDGHADECKICSNKYDRERRKRVSTDPERKRTSSGEIKIGEIISGWVVLNETKKSKTGRSRMKVKCENCGFINSFDKNYLTRGHVAPHVCNISQKDESSKLEPLDYTPKCIYEVIYNELLDFKNSNNPLEKIKTLALIINKMKNPDTPEDRAFDWEADQKFLINEFLNLEPTIEEIRIFIHHLWDGF